jgi:hypothetical protein
MVLVLVLPLVLGWCMVVYVYHPFYSTLYYHTSALLPLALLPEVYYYYPYLPSYLSV